ncbi:MAG: methyltransferase [Candidatus Midichloriaceae bacterium]|jgi:16S rRNA (guanine966-N2)-methyltransferase|nr:methyltransferase [Candidatus Midichloriaceae bacterium]
MKFKSRYYILFFGKYLFRYMRITTGKYKNKPIITKLKGEEAKYRPTTERTRMAVFNLIAHSKFVEPNLIEEAIIADVCCGSGAFGIEALSRGAAKVYFIDKDYARIKLAKTNIANLKEEQNSVFMTSDATNLMPLPDKFNIVYIDPPYTAGIAGKILVSIEKSLTLHENHIVIIEALIREEIELPSNFTALDQREYGRTKIIIGQFN